MVEPVTITVPTIALTDELREQIKAQVQKCMVTRTPFTIDPNLPEDLKHELADLISTAGYASSDSDYLRFAMPRRDGSSVTYEPWAITRVEKWYEDE